MEPKILNLYYLICRSLSIIGLGLGLSTAFAFNDGSQTYTLDGVLYQKGTTNPLLDSNVTLKVQILNPAGTCVLYEELQTVDTLNSKGYFNIQVGSALASPKRTVNDPGRTMAQVFQNTSGISANSTSGSSCSGASYIPTVGDSRYLRMTVTPSSTMVTDVLSPDIVVDSVPQAIVAQSVQGLERANILTANTAGTVSLNQTNLESLFTSTAWTNLQSILSGNFMRVGTSGATLPSYATTPSGVSAGQMWYDSTTNQVKYQSNSGVQTIGSSTGGISSFTVASAFSVNGNVAGSVSNGTATLDLSNTGVTAGTYAKVTVDTKGRVTAGSVSLTEAELPVISTAGKVSGNAITSGVISGSTSFLTSGNLITSGVVSGTTLNATSVLAGTVSGTTLQGTTLTGSTVQANNLRIYNGAQSVQFTAQAMSASYSLALPTADGISGQVLSTNGSGILNWTTPSSGIAATISIGQGGTAATSFSSSRIIASNSTGTALVSYSCSLNQVISFDAAGMAQCSSVSSLAGNSLIANGGNATSATVSIGTKDNQALQFKTNDAVSMTISQNGYVGIGVATPLGFFEVQGGTSVVGNGASISLVAQNGMASGATNGGNIYFVPGQKNSTGTPGSVYVGTSTPVSWLPQGSLYIYGDVFANGSGGFITQSGSALNFGTSTAGIAGWGLGNTSDSLRFNTNSVERLRIDGSGNIGVGNSSPTTSLDISGALTARGISSAAIPGVSPANQGRIYFDYAANRFKVSENGGAYQDLVGGASAGAVTNGGNTTGADISIGTNDNKALLIKVNNANAVTISQSGNMGIGTTTPAVTLDMGAKTDGVRMPNGTTAQQVTCNAGTAGTMRYNSTTTFMEYCDGTNWNAIPKVQSAIAPTVPATAGYLVLTNTAWDGNLGGMAGANAKCLTEIGTTYTNWMGYTDANSRGLLTAAKVKALLCDQSTCNNLIPLATYYFAVANQPAAGGASLTADASGFGPNDAAVWSAANRFNGTTTYWMNRGPGSGNLWAGTPYDTSSNGTCNYWAAASNVQISRVGSTGYGDINRWRTAAPTCDTTARLICIVNP